MSVSAAAGGGASRAAGGDVPSSAPGADGASLLERSGAASLGHRETRGVRVGELFAGVGGFRCGLEPLGFRFAWANQWEPGKKAQHAAELYQRHFGPRSVIVRDVRELDFRQLPDVDLVVGGFPCQDYSAAKPLIYSMGIEGKKGALWWEIARVLEEKRPGMVLLENVDRLLISPAHQRGNDFAVMLATFQRAGYSVEWRVVNAADYGFPQKRKRTFIFARRGTSAPSGVFERAFPCDELGARRSGVLPSASDKLAAFQFDFEAAGAMVAGLLGTWRVAPRKEPGLTLGDVVERGVGGRYVVGGAALERWKYLKGAKNETRLSKASGWEYQYKEGACPFPDSLDRPARTLLTKEGSVAPSRTGHIIVDPESGGFRILTPLEVERLQGFPDGWTMGAPEAFRYFAMGNALVVGVVRRIGEAILAGGASLHVGDASSLPVHGDEEPGLLTVRPRRLSP